MSSNPSPKRLQHFRRNPVALQQVHIPWLKKALVRLFPHYPSSAGSNKSPALVEDGSPSVSLATDTIDVDAPLVTTSERKLMAKVDLHVIPVLAIMYLLAFLDRVNIGNARIFGLEKDLGLTGTQYNTALTIFFVPYVIFEVCTYSPGRDSFSGC